LAEALPIIPVPERLGEFALIRCDGRAIVLAQQRERSANGCGAIHATGGCLQEIAAQICRDRRACPVQRHKRRNALGPLLPDLIRDPIHLSPQRLEVSRSGYLGQGLRDEARSLPPPLADRIHLVVVAHAAQDFAAVRL
jgi:hypothetical protein